MKRRGFTLIELLVVVAIIALLIAILLPSLGKARELTNRGTCAANVRGIMQSMAVYSHDNSDFYPFITTAANTNAVAPVGTTGNLNGAVTTDVFYMIGSGACGAKQFLCKSDPANTNTSANPTSQTGPGPNGYPGYNPTYFVNPSAGQDNNFCYSYSFATPFFNNTVGAWWRATMDSSCPIAADMNPGPNTFPSNVAKRNSVNHQGDGQVVGFGDVHAEFIRTPLAGEQNDHIYTQGTNAPASQPGASGNSVTTGTGNTQGTFDTWLVPAAAQGTYIRG